MATDWRRRWGVPLALATLLPVCLDGCVSVGISRSRTHGSAVSTGSLNVRIFETPDDRRRGSTTTRKIVSELVRSDVRPVQPVYRGTDAVWSRTDLPPGRYRLTALAWVDENGREQPLSNQDSERFRLRAGETIDADVIVKRAPIGAIAGLSGGTVAIIVALIVIASLPFEREPILEPDHFREVEEKDLTPVRPH